MCPITIPACMLFTVFFAIMLSGFLISILGSCAALWYKASAQTYTPGAVIAVINSPFSLITSNIVAVL